MEPIAVTPYRKRVKGKIYRWIIQLPSGVEAPETVYVLSKKPLIVSEEPELKMKNTKKCDEEAVKLLKEKLENKTFRKAVGGAVVEAIEKLLKLCE